MQKTMFIAAALAAIPMAAVPVHAADLNWDINGNTAGLGSAGTWDTTNAFWNTSVTGTGGTVSAWTNGTFDNAIFGGTAGTVTASGSIDVHNITFGTTGYTVSGGTLNLGGVTPTVTVNAGLTDTISSVLAGSAGLTKAGTGTLTLTGTNTFSGGINVTAGILSVNGNTGLGDASNGVTMAAGTTLTANTGTNLASTRVVTLSGGTVTLSGTRVGSARFTGAGGVSLVGGVTLTNNANDYTGQTVFGGAAGTYSFSSIADLGVASALGAPTTVANGTLLLNHTSGTGPILNYTGTGHSSNRVWSLGGVSGSTIRLRNSGTGTLTLSGSITFTSIFIGSKAFEANGGDMVLSGVIASSNPGGTTFSSTSGRTITLGNANTYQGVTTISNATVQAGVLANLGVASSFGTASGGPGNISINTNGILSYTGTGGGTGRPWFFNSGTLSNNGSGTLALSGSMTLTGNATLGGSFNGAANSASGVISGAGTLAVNTAGTWALTNTNTYTGGTALNGGILQTASDANLGNAGGGLAFNGGTLQNTTVFTTARTVTLSGNGTFQTDADLTLSGAIVGAGALTKTSAGTLILTAGNSYTGGTTVSAGTLQLGDGGTSGSITGDVANNASLIFNRSDALALNGAISGTGSVSQLGGGTTTLGGVNTYTGGTTITAGRLTGSASSFGSGAIANSAVLVIDQPAEAAFANAINGTGSFTKQGAGRLNYTGTGTLSGVTTVATGLLSVNGSLANSAVTVLSGASLGGTGTVGATSVQSGGTIAPGNSIGTLQINGAYTQAAGSVYQVEVDPNTNASDRIAVTGTATLQSGTGLNVTKSVAGDYRLGTVYTVLTATGGRTGTYTLSGDTAGATAFLGLRDSYDANNAYLTVVQIRDPVAAAQTGNQQAVATAINTLPVSNPVPTAVLNLPSDDAARSAFDQLGAQAQASAKGALVSNGLYVRDLSLDRLRDVRCDSAAGQASHRACGSELPSLWAQGFGGWGGVSGNANASGLNHTAAGMLAGFDLPIMDWRAGLFAGFSNADFHLTSGPASGESTDYHLGAYAGTNWDQISLSLGASYTWNTIRTDRTVAFGTFTDRLQALTNAGVTQLFAEAGYGMDMWGITLEPFANLAYLNLRTDGFTEVGGAAALTSQADTIENVISTFGVRPSTTVDLGSFPVTVRGMAGWRHTFGTVTPTSTVAFAGGNAFTVSGAPIARDAMALEAGVDFAVADNISAGLTYGGQLSSRTTDQTARGTIRIAF